MNFPISIELAREPKSRSPLFTVVRAAAAIVLFPSVLIPRNALLFYFPGLTMNTLSFLVLNSSPLCHTSLSVFLRALAVSDNGALIFNFATGLGRGHFPSFSKLYMVITNHLIFSNDTIPYCTYPMLHRCMVPR